MKFPEHLLHWFEERQSRACHRQLLVITGNEKWVIKAAVNLLGNNDKHNILWVGNAQEKFANITIKNYRSQLGNEFDSIVLNCFSGFRANAAMALSGAIRANGLMVILCPEFKDWPNYADPEQINRISYGYLHKPVESFFIQYLISTFYKDKSVAILSADKFSGEIFFVKDNLKKEQYYEQESAIEGIHKVAQGRRNRPLVITADRGRGKSSALGLAAAKLMTQGTKTIMVTALHIDNTEQIFRHAQRMLTTSNRTKNELSYQGNTLCFKPVDELLKSEENINIVLVDEAASLPIHVLIKLANKFPRIVFSSTVHGYEGSGRGFEMRFIKQLSSLKPGFKRIQMLQPIRWYKRDTLEQFWFKAMFHNERQNVENNDLINQEINCQHISKTQLLKDKELLASLFKLLIDAHYQTSQDDLQRLLDAPEIECFILTAGNNLLGVVQIVKEGGEPFNELADSVANCSRRVKGHLVAQNITSSYNKFPFLLAQQWRISRIAIHPEHQRKGLGNQLINYVEQQAELQNIKFLTASFGCNGDILRFWQHNQFSLAKLSAKPEVSSGEHSGICIKPLTVEATQISVSILKKFHLEMHYQMDKNFQYVSADTLIQILLLQPNTDINIYEDMEILWQFVMGKRAYSTCKRLLKEYLIVNPQRLLILTAQQQDFLVATLLQNVTDKYVCSNFNLSGKKHIEEIIKKSFKEILQTNN